MNSSFLPGRVNMYASSSRRLASFCHSSPGILWQQRALEVHDFVVRERHDEVLAVLVQHRERQLVLMEAAMDRIAREVRERVVHPAHVPLEREAEPTVAHRRRHAGPRRGLFGDRDRSPAPPRARPR